MKERPIIFSASMVRAILDGSKTQTRRVMKVQPPPGNYRLGTILSSTVPGEDGRHLWNQVGDDGFSAGEGREPTFPCPYGQPGDRLWVKETHRLQNRYRNVWCTYIADGLTTPVPSPQMVDIARPGNRPSIFMHRWASRITLKVTDVRVERLQDISDEDSLAEGVYPTSTGLYPGSPRAAYQKIWKQINGTASWDANPWVWVVEFRRLP